MLCMQCSIMTSALVCVMLPSVSLSVCCNWASLAKARASLALTTRRMQKPGRPETEPVAGPPRVWGGETSEWDLMEEGETEMGVEEMIKIKTQKITNIRYVMCTFVCVLLYVFLYVFSFIPIVLYYTTVPVKSLDTPYNFWRSVFFTFIIFYIVD